VLEQPLRVQRADDAERRPVAGGGERARVAVREDGEWPVSGRGVLLLQPGGAEAADGCVVLEVSGEDLLGGLDIRV